MYRRVLRGPRRSIAGLMRRTKAPGLKRKGRISGLQYILLGSTNAYHFESRTVVFQKLTAQRAVS
jgi:hypothetical protein